MLKKDRNRGKVKGQETQQFFLWFGQSLLHVVATSFGQGLHSTPLKWSKDQTWVPRILTYINLVYEETPQIGVSHALHKWSISRME
jgi:hypothetical protein